MTIDIFSIFAFALSLIALTVSITNMFKNYSNSYAIKVILDLLDKVVKQLKDIQNIDSLTVEIIKEMQDGNKKK